MPVTAKLFSDLDATFRKKDRGRLSTGPASCSYASWGRIDVEGRKAALRIVADRGYSLSHTPRKSLNIVCENARRKPMTFEFMATTRLA